MFTDDVTNSRLNPSDNQSQGAEFPGRSRMLNVSPMNVQGGIVRTLLGRLERRGAKC